MKTKILSFFNLAVRFWLGSIFLTTGWLKAVEPYENFRGALAQYGLMPPFLMSAAAQIVPWVELLTGLFLIAGYALPAAVLVAGLLSGSFVLLIGISFITGAALPEHCGCFGTLLSISPSKMFLLDTLNLILAFLLLRYPSTFLALDGLFVTKVKK